MPGKWLKTKLIMSLIKAACQFKTQAIRVSCKLTEEDSQPCVFYNLFSSFCRLPFCYLLLHVHHKNIYFKTFFNLKDFIQVISYLGNAHKFNQLLDWSFEAVNGFKI